MKYFEKILQNQNKSLIFAIENKRYNNNINKYLKNNHYETIYNYVLLTS